MASSIKSIVKYQWVGVLPTLIASTVALVFLWGIDLFNLYLPIMLGIIAGGVSDIDNKFSGKIWNSIIVFFIFLIGELTVLFTYHFWFDPLWFWLFPLIIVGSTFLFVILGTWSKNLKTLGWGGVLIICYSIFLTLHSVNFSSAVGELFWMFVAAMFYNLVSLSVHLIFPNRGIKKNISDLYDALANYLEVKSRFFDPDDDSYEQQIPLEESGEADYREIFKSKVYNREYERARNHLIEQFALTKEALTIRVKSFGNRKVTRDMLRYYLTADNIFKKLDHNLSDYKALKHKLHDSDIMFRIQRILALFARSARKFSYELKSNNPPVLDKRIIIGIEKLEQSIVKKHQLHYYHVDSLQVLLDNLKKVYVLFININNPDLTNAGANLFTKPSKQILTWNLLVTKFFGAFTPQNPSFRHAIRLAVFQLASFVVFYFFNLQFAFWFFVAGVFVIQPNYTMTKARVKQRSIGTVIGAIIGGFLSFDPHSYPVLLMVIGASTLTLFQFTRVMSYGYSTAFLTIAVFCTFRLYGLDVSVSIVIERIIANLLGALTTWPIIYYLFPEWNYIDLGKNVRLIYNYNKRLLLSLAAQFTDKNPEEFVNNIAKHLITAQNAQRSLQAVVFNIVSEPKIYRLYINPTLKLTALNDYILSNLSLIIDTINDGLEGQKPLSIAPETKDMVEKLALIYARLYSYNDEELRQEVDKLLALAPDEEDSHEEDEIFSHNYYIRERIVGIGVALINYRRELAQIYQIYKIDQKIVQKAVSASKRLFNNPFAKRDHDGIPGIVASITSMQQHAPTSDNSTPIHSADVELATANLDSQLTPNQVEVATQERDISSETATEARSGTVTEAENIAENILDPTLNSLDILETKATATKATAQDTQTKAEASSAEAYTPVADPTQNSKAGTKLGAKFADKSQAEVSDAVIRVVKNNPDLRDLIQATSFDQTYADKALAELKEQQAQELALEHGIGEKSANHISVEQELNSEDKPTTKSGHTGLESIVLSSPGDAGGIYEPRPAEVVVDLETELSSDSGVNHHGDAKAKDSLALESKSASLPEAGEVTQQASEPAEAFSSGIKDIFDPEASAKANPKANAAGDAEAKAEANATDKAEVTSLEASTPEEKKSPMQNLQHLVSAGKEAIKQHFNTARLGEQEDVNDQESLASIKELINQQASHSIKEIKSEVNAEEVDNIVNIRLQEAGASISDSPTTTVSAVTATEDSESLSPPPSKLNSKTKVGYSSVNGFSSTATGNQSPEANSSSAEINQLAKVEEFLEEEEICELEEELSFDEDLVDSSLYLAKSTTQNSIWLDTNEELKRLSQAEATQQQQEKTKSKPHSKSDSPEYWDGVY